VAIPFRIGWFCFWWVGWYKSSSRINVPNAAIQYSAVNSIARRGQNQDCPSPYLFLRIGMRYRDHRIFFFFCLFVCSFRGKQTPTFQIINSHLAFGVRMMMMMTLTPCWHCHYYPPPNQWCCVMVVSSLVHSVSSFIKNDLSVFVHKYWVVKYIVNC